MTTKTPGDLIVAASVMQSRSIPQYAKDLIHDLARSLDHQVRYAEGVRERAAKEVDEVRALLANGPADADTFASMPRTCVGNDETEERPLGHGVVVEYRAPDMEPGEGFEVSIKEGRLHVRGINRLAVVPVHPGELWIETR